MTERYQISVSNHCAENLNICENVLFSVKKTETEEVSLHSGKSFNSQCKNNDTACKQQGYVFFSDSHQFIMRGSGILEIFDLNGKPVMQEQGVWLH